VVTARCEDVVCDYQREMVTYCHPDYDFCYLHPTCIDPPPPEELPVLSTCDDLECEFGYVCEMKACFSNGQGWWQAWCERDHSLCDEGEALGMTCPEGQACTTAVEYSFDEPPRMIAFCEDDDGDTVSWGGGDDEPTNRWGSTEPGACNGLCWHGARCTDYCPPDGSCTQTYDESPNYWIVHSCRY